MVRRAAAAAMLLVSVLLLHLTIGHDGVFGDAEAMPGSTSIAVPAAGQQSLVRHDADDEQDDGEPFETADTTIVGAARSLHRDLRHLLDWSEAAPATGGLVPRTLPLARCVHVSGAGHPPDLAMLQVLRC